MDDAVFRKKVMGEWSFTHIDHDLIPEQWDGNLPLYALWSKRLARASRKNAEAEAETEVAKAEMKRVDADLSVKIGQRPNKYHIKRLTDTAVAKVILLQPEYQEAQRKYFAAQRKAIAAKELENVTRSACMTIWMRKERLQDALKQQIYRMNSDPKYPKGDGVGDAVRNLEQRSRQRRRGFGK